MEGQLLSGRAPGRRDVAGLRRPPSGGGDQQHFLSAAQGGRSRILGGAGPRWFPIRPQGLAADYPHQAPSRCRRGNCLSLPDCLLSRPPPPPPPPPPPRAGAPFGIFPSGRSEVTLPHSIGGPTFAPAAVRTPARSR